MAESNAGVLTYAGQARTVLVTQRALVIIEVRMALGGREKDEKIHYNLESTLPYQGSASMSAGKLEFARNQTATCQGVSKALITWF